MQAGGSAGGWTHTHTDTPVVVHHWLVFGVPKANEAGPRARLVRASRSARSVIQAGEGESTGATRVCSLVGTLAPTGRARGGGSPGARGRGARRGHGTAKLSLRGLDPVPNPGAACARAPRTNRSSCSALLCSALLGGWMDEWDWSWSRSRRGGWDGRVALACSVPPRGGVSAFALGGGFRA